MSTTDLEAVPTNPRDLAAYPGFPSDFLYGRLLDRVGKVDADIIWAQARVAADLAHPSTVKS